MFKRKTTPSSPKMHRMGITEKSAISAFQWCAILVYRVDRSEVTRVLRALALSRCAASELFLVLKLLYLI
jgi:hypothetical protein